MNAAVNLFDQASLGVARDDAAYALLNTIVIVGGGFCGTVLAANLLRRPPAAPTKIVLIERSEHIGRGVAYAANGYPYLLNVPASRMSADSQDPLEFLSFAQRRIPGASGEDFLPRALYGEYLQEVLRSAERTAPSHVHFEHIAGEARKVARLGSDDNFVVELADGTTLFADDVVLALGNPSPAPLPGAQLLKDHPAYIDNPWRLRKAFAAGQSVLIVGTGLTMADVVLKLTDDERQLPNLHAISRRGLIPFEQTTTHAKPLSAEMELRLSAAGSVRKLLATVRKTAREIEDNGGDWRDLITQVRNLAPRLWQQWSPVERNRFVRHVQAYWDVCRHRLPTHVSEHLEYVRESGKLNIHAGRIQTLSPEGERIRVNWLPRGRRSGETFAVDAVINATGPNYCLAAQRDPLLQSLRMEGLVSQDSAGVGLRTGSCGAVVGADGWPSEHLFYLGPMLRADHWETTAAAELRVHAEKLAGLLTSERNS